MVFLNWLSNMFSESDILKDNTVCNWIAYQDEEPDSLKRYRKF